MTLCPDGVPFVQHSLFEVCGGMCTQQSNSRGTGVSSAMHLMPSSPEMFSCCSVLGQCPLLWTCPAQQSPCSVSPQGACSARTVQVLKPSAASLSAHIKGPILSAMGKTCGCSCRAVSERRPGSWAAGTQELYTDTETLQGKAVMQCPHLLHLERCATWRQVWGTESFRVVPAPPSF